MKTEQKVEKKIVEEGRKRRKGNSDGKELTLPGKFFKEENLTKRKTWKLNKYENEKKNV